MKKIKKILIANRGEIAVRIIQAAKELNIISVAVFTEVDRMALHVQKADEVYPLVQKKIEPYLDIIQILRIAEKAGVDAIHPGYGFLSENAVFAKKVEEGGFIFIGPGYESIRLMGDKLLAKQMAIDVGIDVVPGCMVDDPSDPELTSKINHIGYPIMIKARAGGGGKGMRIVYDQDQFNEQLDQSIREAEAAFGDGSVFVEKYIEKPRHIEFQILSDHHGNAVHLFERECSIQRRHQKIIEEAPSAILTKTEIYIG